MVWKLEHQSSWLAGYSPDHCFVPSTLTETVNSGSAPLSALQMSSASRKTHPERQGGDHLQNNTEP
jgi:hypothetical protein